MALTYIAITGGVRFFINTKINLIMKRIGNFLFVEQWFADHEPEQAIVNINKIDNICSAQMNDYKQHSVIETPEGKIAITGNHNDNIIELSKLLSAPDEINDVDFDM